MTKKIAIIGGGIAGLTCALELDKEQFDITIFDKGRGKGGRVATRRYDDHHFDHGAQYISEPTDDKFKIQFKKWKKEGIIKEWNGKLGALKGNTFSNTFKDKKVYVGVPNMSEIGNYLGEQLDGKMFKQQVTITKIFKKFNQWYLEDGLGVIHGGYEVLILTIPPPQAITLVEDFPYLVEILNSVEMSPRWACLISLKYRLNVGYDAVFVDKVRDGKNYESTIRWMARNNSKPERPEKESWIIHASKEWSQQNLEKTPEWVADQLVEEFHKVVGFDDLPVKDAKGHRWRYAIVDQDLDQNFILDNNRNIALAGDFCMGNNIEAAYISGETLGRRLNNMRV